MGKRKSKKKNTLVLLLLLLVGISIGYAALTSNLNINGNTNIKKVAWDVHFENLVKSEGSETAEKDATIDASKTLVEYTVKLPEPGDFYEFTVDIVNKGNIDAMVSEVLKTGLDTDQQKYIEYTAAYTRGAEVGEKDILKAGKSKNIKVRVKYKDDLNSEDLPTEDKPINLSFQVTYVQADETAKEPTPSIMRSYTNKSTDDYHNSKYKSKVTKIDFKGDEEIPTTAIESWDVSQNQDKSVMAYIEDDGTGVGTYKVTIVGDGNVVANEDSSYLFYLFSNLKEIDLNNLDTSKVTNMSNMFSGDKNLTSLDLSNLDTSSVTNMNMIFYNCSSLTSIDLSNFDTSKVTNMSGMFDSCSSLTSLDVSKFDTSKVTNMSGMFDSCSSLTSLDVSKFDTGNVTGMRAMFSECRSLTSLNLSSFDTSKVKSMNEMFYYCSSLASLDLSKFDTSNVTNMWQMFQGCGSLTSLDLSNFDTSNVTNMKQMFYSCSKLTTTITIKSSNITDFTSIFAFAATANSAQITVNYTNETSSIVDQMIAKKSSDSNVVKGSLVS